MNLCTVWWAWWMVGGKLPLLACVVLAPSWSCIKQEYPDSLGRRDNSTAIKSSVETTSTFTYTTYQGYVARIPSVDRHGRK